MAKKKVIRKRGRARTSSKKLKKSSKAAKKPMKKPVKKAVKKKAKKVGKKPAKRPAKRRPVAVHKEETFLEKVEHELKHEEELIMRKHVGKYKIPVGIKVLSVYMIFLGILYAVSFFSTLAYPTTILFGNVITGTSAIVLNLLVMLSLVAIVYGLIRRKAFTFDLAIAWFGLGLLNSFVSFFLLDSARYSVFGGFMFLSFLSLVVVNTLVIWYLIVEKKYFYARSFHDRPWHHKDKVFVYTLVSFWVLVLLIGVSSAVSFYGETARMVDQTVIELGASNPFFVKETCLAKEGREKDVCFTVLATMYNTSDINDIASVCQNIDSDFFRFTCLRSLR